MATTTPITFSPNFDNFFKGASASDITNANFIFYKINQAGGYDKNSLAKYYDAIVSPELKKAIAATNSQKSSDDRREYAQHSLNVLAGPKLGEFNNLIKNAYKQDLDILGYINTIMPKAGMSSPTIQKYYKMLPPELQKAVDILGTYSNAIDSKAFNMSIYSKLNNADTPSLSFTPQLQVISDLANAAYKRSDQNMAVVSTVLKQLANGVSQNDPNLQAAINAANTSEKKLINAFIALPADLKTTGYSVFNSDRYIPAAYQPRGVTPQTVPTTPTGTYTKDLTTFSNWIKLLPQDQKDLFAKLINLNLNNYNIATSQEAYNIATKLDDRAKAAYKMLPDMSPLDAQNAQWLATGKPLSSDAYVIQPSDAKLKADIVKGDAAIAEDERITKMYQTPILPSVDLKATPNIQAAQQAYKDLVIAQNKLATPTGLAVTQAQLDQVAKLQTASDAASAKAAQDRIAADNLQNPAPSTPSTYYYTDINGQAYSQTWNLDGTITEKPVASIPNSNKKIAYALSEGETLGGSRTMVTSPKGTTSYVSSSQNGPQIHVSPASEPIATFPSAIDITPKVDYKTLPNQIDILGPATGLQAKLLANAGTNPNQIKVGSYDISSIANPANASIINSAQNLQQQLVSQLIGEIYAGNSDVSAQPVYSFGDNGKVTITNPLPTQADIQKAIDQTKAVNETKITTANDAAIKAAANQAAALKAQQDAQAAKDAAAKTALDKLNADNAAAAKAVKDTIAANTTGVSDLTAKAAADKAAQDKAIADAKAANDKTEQARLAEVARLKALADQAEKDRLAAVAAGEAQAAKDAAAKKALLDAEAAKIAQDKTDKEKAAAEAKAIQDKKNQDYQAAIEAGLAKAEAERVAQEKAAADAKVLADQKEAERQTGLAAAKKKADDEAAAQQKLKEEQDAAAKIESDRQAAELAARELAVRNARIAGQNQLYSWDQYNAAQSMEAESAARAQGIISTQQTLRQQQDQYAKAGYNARAGQAGNVAAAGSAGATGAKQVLDRASGKSPEAAAAQQAASAPINLPRQGDQSSSRFGQVGRSKFGGSNDTVLGSFLPSIQGLSFGGS